MRDLFIGLLLILAIAGFLFSFSKETKTIVSLEESLSNTNPTTTIASVKPVGEILGDEQKISGKPEVEIKTINLPLPIEVSPLPPPPPEPPKRIPDNQIYSLGLERTVNLICKVKNEYIAASGAVIDKAGFVLSNAHVGENIGEGEECEVRNGSPAKFAGWARLVFLPEAYKTATSEQIRTKKDYAIWKIRNIEETPSWEFDGETALRKGEVLLTQSYPAELLGDELILSNLYLVFSNTQIEASDSIVVRSTRNIASQKGSSGGILIDPYTAKVRALIFGIGDEAKEIFSLSIYGINESLKQETGKNLSEYLGDLR